MNIKTFTNEYNQICKVHLAKNSNLSDLTNHELYIWITGQTLKFGRSLEDSFENADCHMMDRKKAEQLFSVKQNDLMGLI